MRRTRQTFAVLVVLAFVSGAATAQVLYDAYELGLPDGCDEGEAAAINSVGDVVGHASGADVAATAVVWPGGGSPVALGPLQAGHSSGAKDINDAGWVVGHGARTVGYWDPDAGEEGAVVQVTVPRAAIWDPTGAVTELPVAVSLGGNYTGQEFQSYTRAITDGSDGAPIRVLGYYYVVPTQETVACIWTIGEAGTTRQDLGLPVLRDMNNAGQTCWTATGYVAYASWAAPDPLPTLGGARTGANAIGEGAHVVGFSNLAKLYSHACLWHDAGNGAVAVDLGTIGGKWKASYAVGVNTAGQAVGVSHLPDSTGLGQAPTLDYHATLFTGGQAIDLTAALTTPLWRVVQIANDINDHGWIAGRANVDDGSVYGLSRPCLLIPAAGPPPPNQPPIAQDDAYSVDAGGTLTVAAVQGVLANDSDPEGDPFIAMWAAGPANGTLNYLDADGGFEYVPNAGFQGTDSFTYTAFDGQDSNVATVTITVGSGPVAAGGITGIVTDANGPVKKAIVTAYDDAGYPAATAKTLPSGAYTLSGLPPGLYTVEAVLGDLSGSVVDVPVVSGQTTTGVDITIQ